MNQEIISDIFKIINDYDIVAIQEVVAKDPAGAQAVARIVDNLNKYLQVARLISDHLPVFLECDIDDF